MVSIGDWESGIWDPAASSRVSGKLLEIVSVGIS